MDLAPTSTELLSAAQMAEVPGKVMALSYRGGRSTTRMVCGFLACDDTLSNPLLSSLPRFFKVDMRYDPRAAWLEPAPRFRCELTHAYVVGHALAQRADGVIRTR